MDNYYTKGIIILGPGEPIRSTSGYPTEDELHSPVTCGHPAKNGVECRACALDRWRASA